MHYAMPFLTAQNRRVGHEQFDDSNPILAGGKHVVVIGGGDTASDCIGTSFRQGAVQVTQLDIRPKPPEVENKFAFWPYWPTKMRTSSSQAEGVEREFTAVTLGMVGERGHVTGVRVAKADEKRQPIAGTDHVIKADLVLIALGFSGPSRRGSSSRARCRSTGAAMCKPIRKATAPPTRKSMPRAICGAASHSWSGRSGKGARLLTPLIWR